MSDLSQLKTKYNIVGGKRYNDLVDVVAGKNVDFSVGTSTHTQYGATFIPRSAAGSGAFYNMSFGLGYTELLSANPGNQLYINPGWIYIGTDTIEVPGTIVSLSGSATWYIYAHVNLVALSGEILTTTEMPSTWSGNDMTIPLHRYSITSTLVSATSSTNYAMVYEFTYSVGDQHFYTLKP